jgi:acetoin utilization deacetylase AcuC-like enzyme
MTLTDDGRRLAVLWDDACLAYRPPDGAYYLESSDLLAVDEPHPERPERLENIRAIVERCLDEYVDWVSVAAADTDQLAAVHQRSYIEQLDATYADEPGYVTGATWVDERMLRAARLAAGAAIQAAERAVTDPDTVPYALVRPGGHHAQPACADGYCLFNNVSLAAEHARRRPEIDRVAIVDWDVHHGNGTQEIFYDRDDVLTLSIHDDHGPWDPVTHPQTGQPAEHGAGDGEGYNVNVPLPGATGDRGYERVFERVVEPIVADFDPDVVIVCAGQDPGIIDPQGRNVVTKAGFKAMARRVAALADEHAAGRYALMQAGGYQLSHLPYATLGVLEGAIGVDTGVDDPYAGWNEQVSCLERTLDSVVDHYAPYWPLS